VAAVAERVESVELGQHLRRCLGAWYTPV
jgi:hypothetical protein